MGRNTARPPLGNRYVKSAAGIIGAVGLMAIVLAASSCSNSSQSNGTTTSTTVSVPASALSQPTAASAIGQAYGVAFDLADKHVSPKLSALQNGSKLLTAVTQALTSSLSNSSTSAHVDSVIVLNASQCHDSAGALPWPCASVDYELIGVNGQPLFQNPVHGYAVYEHGDWLVANTTMCSILDLIYSGMGRNGGPPGC